MSVCGPGYLRVRRVGVHNQLFVSSLSCPIARATTLPPLEHDQQRCVAAGRGIDERLIRFLRLGRKPRNDAQRLQRRDHLYFGRSRILAAAIDKIVKRFAGIRRR